MFGVVIMWPGGHRFECWNQPLTRWGCVLNSNDLHGGWPCPAHGRSFMVLDCPYCVAVYGFPRAMKCFFNWFLKSQIERSSVEILPSYPPVSRMVDEIRWCMICMEGWRKEEELHRDVCHIGPYLFCLSLAKMFQHDN